MEEVIEALDVQASDTVVDATLGGAGHFARILSTLGSDGILVGIDADGEAVERARAVVTEDRRADRPVVHLITDNFRNLGRILDRLEVAHFDKALFDLGWSGYQLSVGRGFSFQSDEALMMNYGEGGATAAEIVNGVSEKELADIIFEYGEERFARKIAKAIVEARKRERILTTGQLVAVIERAVPAFYRGGKIHPATKTFQALRIAVNDEFGALREGFAAALARVAPKGRIAVITFHSSEDRIVKEMIRDAAYRELGVSLTKKPIAPSTSEIAKNRRARSAKLRVFERSAAAVVSDEALLTRHG